MQSQSGDTDEAVGGDEAAGGSSEKDVEIDMGEVIASHPLNSGSVERTMGVFR